MNEWNEYFYYDPSSPTHLRNKVERTTGQHGQTVMAAKDGVAGSIKRGRASVGFKGKVYKVHRVIYEMHYGQIPVGMVVDHIDGDTLNNSPSNLRAVTGSVNARNRRKPKNNTSGFYGVHLQKVKHHEYWCAQWVDLTGRLHSSRFSISKLGSEEALKLACKAREDAIQCLNLEGAGYTERNGT